MKYIPFAGKIFLTLLLNVLAVLAAAKILSVYSEYDFNMIKQKYETKRKKRLEGL